MNGQFWNQSPGSVTSATQQPQQQIVGPNGQPVQQQQPDDLDRLLDTKLRERAETYRRGAEETNKKLTELSNNFLSDDTRKPFFPLAVEHFNALQAAAPDVPMERHYDATLQYVAKMQQMGVQPPAQPQQPQFTGIPGHTQNYQGGVPILGDSKYRTDEAGLGIRPGFISDEQRDKINENYIEARKRDLENCKSRGEAGESMKEYYVKLETTQAS